ncbi:MAG TPA: alpha/beta fold hydrolase [Bauldia sp.]|nr:alpha/beta fold hydrolase [Bauldia sp.]
MAEATAERLIVGTGSAVREIALLRRPGSGDAATPGLFWLGGFMSNMTGSKAAAVDAFAAERGLAATRFDYSGHGASSGSFTEGTVSRWLEEAAAVFATTSGPQIVVGSSMGGWLALLLAEMARESRRIAGLLLVAPAFDMTRALMWDHMTKKARAALERDGYVREASSYSEEPYVITKALIDDGDRHLFGERLIEVGCPVVILQGLLDKDVPWRHSAALVEKLAADDVVLTLIKDGDHRLSRPEDLERLRASLASLVADVSAPPAPVLDSAP